MPSKLSFIFIAALFSSALGCGDDGDGGVFSGKTRRGSAQVGGSVVSTVNGLPIRVADVEEVVRATGLSAREALQRLQTEQLLMIEAERRGVSSTAIEQVAARARVQALLGAEAAANVATDSELRAAYETDARFHIPELRASTHVLAKLDSKATPELVEAARKIAVRAIADLPTLEPDQLKERYTGLIDGVMVKVEVLPAVDRQKSFVKEYLEALFSLSAPGVVPQPVRTQFGWHAIRVTSITDPHVTSYEIAAKVLRRELTTKKQSDAVKALLVDLRHAHPVEVVAGANEKLSLVDGAESLRGR